MERCFMNYVVLHLEKFCRMILFYGKVLACLLIYRKT